MILSGLSLRAWLAIAAVAWGVLAPAGVWAWTKATDTIDRRRAVNAAIADEQATCARRVKDIEVTINAEMDKRVTAALDAASRIEPTPAAGSPELRRLCDGDANCRDGKR